MPYVNKIVREEINVVPEARSANTAGELNYQITSLVNEYLNRDKTYARINECIGVLECAKLELYRRVAAPYEDTKILENGDVYS